MKKLLCAIYLIILLCSIGVPAACPWICEAGTKEKEGLAERMQEGIFLDEAEETFQNLQGGGDSGGEHVFSLRQYVSDILSGKSDFSLREFCHQAASQIGAQFERQKQTFLRILVLGILSGVFANFAGTLGDKNLSETGFFVTFLLLSATMMAGFSDVTKIASEAVDGLLTFMKTLIPAFSLTLCLGSGTTTSIAYYEAMLLVISFLEMAMQNLFIPGVQIYFMLGLLNQLSENRFTRLAGLVKSFLRFGIKFLFGVLIGYQGIQGMLLPVMDKVKNNTLLQTAKGLPGIGNSIGGVADTVIGSGMLIKSAVGVGGILCIIVLCFYPLLKIFVFQLMYRAGSALVQPVSDKRVASALHVAAESGVFLMKFVFAGALMFLLSITIVIVSTNLAI